MSMQTLTTVLDELNTEIKIDQALIAGNELDCDGVRLIRKDMRKLERKASAVKKKIYARLRAVK